MMCCDSHLDQNNRQDDGVVSEQRDRKKAHQTKNDYGMDWQ